MLHKAWWYIINNNDSFVDNIALYYWKYLSGFDIKKTKNSIDFNLKY